MHTYVALQYSARVPAPWRQVADEVAHEGYVESKWRDPDDPGSSITIDANENQTLTPAGKAAEVRAAVASAPSYGEIAFGPSTLSGQDGYRWVFELSGDRRVDYFLASCDTGIAVLGSTSPTHFDELRATFRRVASSVSIDCTGSQPQPTPEPAPDETPPPSTPSAPEGDFCSTHDCIPSFDEGQGYIAQCADGEWSHSGGRPGACSGHGGETGNTYP